MQTFSLLITIKKTMEIEQLSHASLITTLQKKKSSNCYYNFSNSYIILLE